MKVIKLRIGLIEGNITGISGSNIFRYTAEAIEDSIRHYYRVGDVTIKITKYEYENVIINPYLYYFSTALKLHLRVCLQKKRVTVYN